MTLLRLSFAKSFFTTAWEIENMTIVYDLPIYPEETKISRQNNGKSKQKQKMINQTTTQFHC